MQIGWVCGILKSTMRKSTEYQPGWKHKITLPESVSKRPKHVFVSKLHCVEIARVEVTDTLDK